MTYSDMASQLLAMAQEAESLTGSADWTVADEPGVGWVVTAGDAWIALLGSGPGVENLANLVAIVSNPNTLTILASWLVTLDEFERADLVPQELRDQTSAIVAAFLGY